MLHVQIIRGEEIINMFTVLDNYISFELKKNANNVYGIRSGDLIKMHRSSKPSTWASEWIPVFHDVESNMPPYLPN